MNKTVLHYGQRESGSTTETSSMLVLAERISAMELADFLGFGSHHVFPAVKDAEHCLCQRGFAGHSNPVLELLSTRTHVTVALTVGRRRVGPPNGLAADVIAFTGSRFDAVSVEAHTWIMPLTNERIVYHTRLKHRRVDFIGSKQTGYARIGERFFDERIGSVGWGRIDGCEEDLVGVELLHLWLDDGGEREYSE